MDAVRRHLPVMRNLDSISVRYFILFLNRCSLLDMETNANVCAGICLESYRAAPCRTLTAGTLIRQQAIRPGILQRRYSLARFPGSRQQLLVLSVLRPVGQVDGTSCWLACSRTQHRCMSPGSVYLCWPFNPRARSHLQPLALPVLFCSLDLISSWFSGLRFNEVWQPGSSNSGCRCEPRHIHRWAHQHLTAAHRRRISASIKFKLLRSGFSGAKAWRTLPRKPGADLWNNRFAFSRVSGATASSALGDGMHGTL
jgi:hypothetical protein